MNPRTIVVGVSLGAVFLSGMAYVDLRPMPLAKPDAFEVNLRPVPRGATARHVFRLSNAGRADLVVGRVAASCFGTAAMKERRIKPGGSSDIEVTFQTRDLPEGSVKNLWTRVETNDPNNPCCT